MHMNLMLLTKRQLCFQDASLQRTFGLKIFFTYETICSRKIKQYLQFFEI